MTTTQKLIRLAEPHWTHYIQHEFVCQLGLGSLSHKNFQYYLKQDYLYLFQYSRMFALAIYKAENFAQMALPKQTLETILQETQLHIAYCKQWGISETELMQEQEDAATIAYTRYVLDCGVSGTLAELYAAVAPCIIGYAQIGKWLTENFPKIPNNPYQDWIDTYASAEFQQSAADFEQHFDALCQDLTASQLAKIQQIFTTATRMEENFWQMGLDYSQQF